MPLGISTSDKFAILRTDRGGMQLDCFPDQQAMCKQLMYQIWPEFKTTGEHITWLREAVNEIAEHHARDNADMDELPEA